MSINTAIKKGYKQTELGVIPGDWEVKKFRDIAMIIRGASPRPIDSPVWFDEKSEIGWVRISDVTKSIKFLRQTTQKLSELGIKSSRFVGKGNLIMSICATVGRPILTELDVCIHDGFVVFIDPKIEKEYLYYFLSFIENDWSKNGQTGSQMNLNTGLINFAQIIFPKLKSEQSAIATVLSDTDALIEHLEKLIAKKKAIKQGTMQQLLTGKKRLPGFSCEWETNVFGSITEIKKGEQLNKSELTVSGEYPDWNGGIEPSGYTDKWNMVENTITISEGGNSCGFVNYCKTKFWLGGHCYALKIINTDLDKGFLYQFLKFKEKSIMVLRIGSGLPNIQKKSLNELELFIPKDKKEQSAIATILSDMDAEIGSLEQKRDKHIMLKQGMMQELLTGKIRIYANN